MEKAVGVRFKPAGKIYDFDCGAFVLQQGDHVIVETEQGLGFGVVTTPPTPVSTARLAKPLKKVHRLANRKDYQRKARNLETEKKAHAFCLQSIEQLKLKMNLFSVESTFDGNKLIFYFTSEGRVDFRELVKKLVAELGVRIEMRQVGIRLQAKMSGGMGRCGREICCAKFMEKFGPVSIRMAKEQGVALNPAKISGQCGRLMCCLTFERDTYRELKQKLPKVGKTVRTAEGSGKVVRHNPLSSSVTIRLEDGTESEIGPEEIIEKGSKPKTGPSEKERK